MDKNKLEENFIRLVTDNQGIIHKVCNMYCHISEDKRDLFQDILIQLWKAYPNYKGAAKFSTWMYRISLNTAITSYRSGKRKPVYQSLSDFTLQVTETQEWQQADEEVKLLYKAIDQLNRIEKALILLYLEKNSYEEIAAIMGITKTNVGVKINRIKAKLESLINSYTTNL